MEAPEAQTTDTFMKVAKRLWGKTMWQIAQNGCLRNLKHQSNWLILIRFRRAFHSRRDEIRNEVMNEFEEHDASVPASPGDYDMTLRDGSRSTFA